MKLIHFWQAYKAIDMSGPKYLAVAIFKDSDGREFFASDSEEWPTRAITSPKQAQSMPLDPYQSKNAAWVLEHYGVSDSIVVEALARIAAR